MGSIQVIGFTLDHLVRLIDEQKPQPCEVSGTVINWDALGIEQDRILANSQRIKGRIKPVPRSELYDEPVAIVGFGASLNKTWPMLRRFKIIYTCSGSHKFLIERGIVPTYHVESDPRPYKADILGTPHKRVTYLASSICHPSYFDKLELHGAIVRLWHIWFSEPKEIALRYPINEWIVTGGHTVGPRAVKIARIMGYVNLHIFGLDCSIGEHGNTHATPHPNPPDEFYKHDFDGKSYLTNRHWAMHAENLLYDLDALPEVKYQFYGEGLQQAMANKHERKERPYSPLLLKIEKVELGAK